MNLMALEENLEELRNKYDEAVGMSNKRFYETRIEHIIKRMRELEC